MTVSRHSVAILGATGHVGKCLTASLLARGEHDVTAIARSSERLEMFLDRLPAGDRVARRSFAEFPHGEYDVVVNCVGVRNSADAPPAGVSIFALTEQFDAVVMDYLEGRPDTLYVAFSSGAAYCGDFSSPADENSPAIVNINAIVPTDYYGVAKLASEVKHRAAADLAIVDLRLFGLFSRYSDLSAPYFMNDVYGALAQDSVLKVGPEDMTRDYIDPDDMTALLVAVIGAGPHNDVYDLYSAAPVAKFDVLEGFSARYGLKYDVLDSPMAPTSTGMKPGYYSTNRRAATLGYEPARTSMQSLAREMDALLQLHEGGRA